MDFNTYREKGKETVDYIADYLENIRNRRVFPDVTPGYIRELLPSEAPQQAEKWDDIFNDVERVIMPGITHWQSPHMHAYFPALNSFPSLLGDMIADAINCLSFTWAASPAATELETLVLDWLVKCLGLPDKFLSSNKEPYGGGVLQTSVSESTYIALLAARTKMFQKYQVGELDKYIEKSEINGRLVCYCSDQAHSSVEKSALVAITRIRLLPTDEHMTLRGETLRRAIDEDKANGLIPFFVCATLGTTGVCAFDNLDEIGPICQADDIWLHIDAAYAGSAFMCAEYRRFLSGVHLAQSFVFNPSKWLMVNFDCTAFWVESSIYLHQTFTVAPLYLEHKYSGAAIDYMHWQVGLSRRFRSLKLWFVLRAFGIDGMQKHIRKGVELAALFERLVRDDERFELMAVRHLGLVVFRMRGENEITECLLKYLNRDGHIHVVPAKVKDNYVIRFTVTSYHTTEVDIRRDWAIICKTASQVLETRSDTQQRLENERKRFQSSLLLCNAPQTPKIVNASFMAFLADSDAFTSELARKLSTMTSTDYSQSHLPLTVRRKPIYLSRGHYYKMFSCDELSSSMPNPRMQHQQAAAVRHAIFNTNGQVMMSEEVTTNATTTTNGADHDGQANKDNDTSATPATPAVSFASSSSSSSSSSSTSSASNSSAPPQLSFNISTAPSTETATTTTTSSSNTHNTTNNSNSSSSSSSMMLNVKFLMKQTSLDSKIQNIFEEVELKSNGCGGAGSGAPIVEFSALENISNTMNNNINALISDAALKSVGNSSQ